MNLRKLFWTALGGVALALGALGAAVPLIPSVPFLLLAAFAFARSSQRLHAWFVGTKLYRNNLESYVRGQGMTTRAKLRIMATVTALMAVGFVMMLRKALYIPCGILAVVWALHVLYFLLGVKTYRPEEEAA